MRILGFAVLSILGASCGGASSTPNPGANSLSQEFPLAREAALGVENQALRGLLIRHWDHQMQISPVWATTLGDHRFDGELGASSEAAVMASRNRNAELLQRARKFRASDLSADDKITLALFIEDLESSQGSEVCDFYQWSLSPRDNPVASANELPNSHKLSDRESAKNLQSRYTQIPRSIEENIDNLRAGLAKGKVANAETVRRTIALVRGVLEKPVTEWALLKPLESLPALVKEGKLSQEDADQFRRELTRLADGPVRQSFQLYADMLEGEVLPKGREGDQIGVHGIPNGLACYEASIRAQVNLPKTAHETHELGLREIARINGEMTELGETLFGTETLAETVEKLRTDKSLYFSTEEEIVQKAKRSLQKAKDTIPAYFGILPKAKCEVTKIPDYAAPYTTIAYYSGPQKGTGKEGEYYINTYEPTTRPRFEMEVLAYHESIPGHHLQIAIAQEREGLPAFRMHGGSTAFVEGWALYTERLAEEMGMYSGDLDRMGMLSYDAWRASRLVVDTGIHAKGWTREEAEAFMSEHTALTSDNIRNEVDRYISWPAQALAYKIGQLEIIALRKHAEEALGDKFDIRGFHDAVLSKGAVTLPVLAGQVDAWIAETTAGTPKSVQN